MSSTLVKSRREDTLHELLSKLTHIPEHQLSQYDEPKTLLEVIRWVSEMLQVSPVPKFPPLPSKDCVKQLENWLSEQTNQSTLNHIPKHIAFNPKTNHFEPREELQTVLLEWINHHTTYEHQLRPLHQISRGNLSLSLQTEREKNQHLKTEVSQARNQLNQLENLINSTRSEFINQQSDQIITRTGLDGSIWCIILQYLCPIDILRVSSTCKILNKVATSDDTWSDIANRFFGLDSSLWIKDENECINSIIPFTSTRWLNNCKYVAQAVPQRLSLSAVFSSGGSQSEYYGLENLVSQDCAAQSYCTDYTKSSWIAIQINLPHEALITQLSIEIPPSHSYTSPVNHSMAFIFDEVIRGEYFIERYMDQYETRSNWKQRLAYYEKFQDSNLEAPTFDLQSPSISKYDKTQCDDSENLSKFPSPEPDAVFRNTARLADEPNRCAVARLRRPKRGNCIILVLISKKGSGSTIDIQRFLAEGILREEHLENSNK